MRWIIYNCTLWPRSNHGFHLIIAFVIALFNFLSKRNNITLILFQLLHLLQALLQPVLWLAHVLNETQEEYSGKQIMVNKCQNIVHQKVKVWHLMFYFSLINPIPAGGGQFDPAPCSFLHNSKSIGLRLLKFSLPLGLKPCFYTNCLSPQAHCLNDCFFL